MKTSGAQSLASPRSLLPTVTLALAAVGLISSAQAQLQVAGALLVDVDATTAAPGAVTSIANNGTLGGVFEARGGGTTIPAAANIHGNGTVGLGFNGGQYLQLVPTLGSAPTVPPAGIVGLNPTFSIEAWVMNPIIQQEETIVSWGKRGGPDGSNNSFNYGWDGAFGAMGHWGGADMGWDSSTSSSGTYPPGVPTPGKWHHLVYTFDGTTQRLFVDGVEKNAENVSLDIAQNTSIVLAAQLEADGATVTAGLRGSLSIGRLRIHDEVLSGAQVLNNYSFEASALSNGGTALAAGPTHRYSFNSSAGAAPDGSDVPESISGANGFIRGAGATFTGSRATLPGGPSGTQAYIDLPNGLLSNNSTNKGGLGEITVEGWVKITGNRNWSRIFDFGSSDIGGGVGGEVPGAGGGGEGKDYLFWSAQNGGDLNVQQVAWRNFDPVNPGAPLDAGFADHYTASAVTFPKDIHFAMTWRESTGLLEIYENGTLVQTMTMPIPMSDINDVNVWLGRSNWAGDQNTQAEYDEFRVYNRVLSPDNLQASYQAGPNSLATTQPVSFWAHPQNQTVNELTSASFFAAADGAPPISLQWYKGTTQVAGGTNNFVTLSNVLPGDNGSQIYAVASNFSGGSPFVVTSMVAILTVNADTTAPTLASARLDDADVVQVIFSEGVNAGDITLANFALSGPAGSPTIASVAPGTAPNRAVLTLSGPITGVGYYTVTVSNVRDLSASQNAIAAGSTVSFWNLLPDGLAHRYTFNNQPAANATGVTVPDTIGTADATVRNGTGATTFTGEKVTLSGGSSATAPYVDLPNGMLSMRSTNNGGSGQITLEGWARVSGGQNWSRIFDFGSSGPCCGTGGEHLGPGGGGEGIDYMFLSAQNGGNTGVRRIDITNRDQGDHGTAGRDYGTTTFGQDFHFAVTWDEASGTVVMYENGIEVTRYSTVAAMSEINDVNVWLGRSNWTGDANLQGEFDEFRVYNRVLTASEVQLNRAGGANSALGAAQSIDLVVTNISFYTNIVRDLPVLVAFANGGTQNVASLSSVVYTTDNPTVAEITAGGVLHTYGVGSAHVTATFNGMTDAADILVTGDNTPPMILEARVEGPQQLLVIFSEPVDEATGGEPFSYFVSGPYGTFDVEDAERIGDNSRVLLRLTSALPPEYITVHSEWVTDLLGNTTDNNGTAGVLNFVPTNLKHRYTFNNGTNNLAANTPVRDTVGGADGLILGAPTVFTGERIVLFGGSSATAGYVDLPNNLLSNNSTNRGGSGQATLETWVKVNGAQNWSRILDFGSTGPCCGAGGEIPGTGGSGEGIDYLMLSAAVEANPLRRRLEIQNRDQPFGFANGDYDTATYQQMSHVMITWDERTGNVRVYENGVQMQSVTTAAALSDINDVNVWLGRSTWLGDNNLQGEFDEFRLYNRVLTASEVTMNMAAGPDNNYGAPVALRINAPAILTIGQVTPYSVMGDFANISNVNLTLAGLALVTSSDPSIVSNTPSGTLVPLDFGTATLRAVYSGLTNTVSIVVSNNTPLARDDGLTTAKNTPATVTSTTLMANDETPHGGPLTFVSVSASSTNGGTVSYTAPNITYTPAAGYSGQDLFTYTVSDSFGVEATGRVFVFVSDGPVPPPQHIAIAAGAGGSSYSVTFSGTPGVTYRIQRATDIAGPWTTISTQTVTASGLINYTDSSPPAGQAFYRVITP